MVLLKITLDNREVKITFLVEFYLVFQILMSKEYFENSRSKTTFILIGVVIAFVLIAILGSARTSKNGLLNYEDRYQQMQSDFQKEKDAFQEYQQLLIQQHQQMSNSDILTSSYALSTSLQIKNGKLIGAVSSSDPVTLAQYQKEIQKYASISNLDMFSFSFEADAVKNIEQIYTLLGHKKVSFKEIWSGK